MNVRQFSYVLLFVLASTSIFIQCKSGKETTEATDTSETKIDETEIAPEEVYELVDMAEIARLFVESIQNINPDALYDLMPVVETARMLSPEETQGMTDEEIRQNMIAVLKLRFKGNLDNIWKAIATEGKKASDIEFLEFEEYPSEDPPSVPRVMSVSFTLDGQTASIPVTYMHYKGKVYLFEILNSTNIFKKF